MHFFPRVVIVTGFFTLASRFHDGVRCATPVVVVGHIASVRMVPTFVARACRRV